VSLSEDPVLVKLDFTDIHHVVLPAAVPVLSNTVLDGVNVLPSDLKLKMTSQETICIEPGMPELSISPLSALHVEPSRTLENYFGESIGIFPDTRQLMFRTLDPIIIEGKDPIARTSSMEKDPDSQISLKRSNATVLMKNATNSENDYFTDGLDEYDWENVGVLPSQDIVEESQKFQCSLSPIKEADTSCINRSLVVCEKHREGTPDLVSSGQSSVSGAFERSILETEASQGRFRMPVLETSTRMSSSLHLEPTPPGIGTIAVALKVLSDYEEDEPQSNQNFDDWKESQELLDETTRSLVPFDGPSANLDHTTVSFVYESAPGSLFRDQIIQDADAEHTIIDQTVLDIPTENDRGILWQMTNTASRNIPLQETQRDANANERKPIDQEMPNYHSMSLVQLQELADQHGIKDLSRSALIDKLQQIWCILHPPKKDPPLDYNLAISTFIQEHTEWYKKVLRYEVLKLLT
jgi:hypothetical protein